MGIKPELCKVDEALGILVGKWKPIILLHLLLKEHKDLVN